MLALCGGELLLGVELELFLMMIILSLMMLLLHFLVVVGIAIVVLVHVVGRRSRTTTANCTTSGKGPPLTFCPCIHCFFLLSL